MRRIAWPTSGYALMVLACLCSALTAMAVGVLHDRQADVSGMAVSFVRVSMQAVVVCLLFSFGLMAGRRHTAPFILTQACNPWLWIWGFLGAATVSTYYIAAVRIGFGAAALLNATSGIFTAVFAPLILRQRSNPTTWLACALAFVGVYFLSSVQPTTGLSPDVLGSKADDWSGWLIGLLSGVMGGLAYVAVVRAGPQTSVMTAMTAWVLACLSCHLLAFAIQTPVFPHDTPTWILAIGGGLSASASQYFMTLAYQRSPAAPLAALGHLTPVISLGLEMLVFARIPNLSQSWGISMILIASLLLPLERLLQVRRQASRVL